MVASDRRDAEPPGHVVHVCRACGRRKLGADLTPDRLLDVRYAGYDAAIQEAARRREEGGRLVPRSDLSQGSRTQPPSEQRGGL